MNTGMGDAVNLAWKLAAVLQNRASPRLLNSYEPERIAFARLLIDTTDRAFRLVTARSALAGFWRQHIMPRIAALITRNKAGARAAFRLVSQIRINYRHSAISVGAVGRLHAGDRLPYVTDRGSDNFTPLNTLDWQIHVYGEVESEFRSALASTGVPLHTFPWTDAARAGSLTRNAANLIRPDGHIALAAQIQDARPFVHYLSDLAIKPRAGQPGSTADRSLAVAS
jgi:hypothetical protein